MHRIIHPLWRLLVGAMIFTSAAASGQEASKKSAATSGELFDTISRLDHTIFDTFNLHDVDRLMAFFTNDLEFYHDTGGLTNYAQAREVSPSSSRAPRISGENW